MTMRKAFSVALMAALVGLVGMTKDASATVTITLEWGACGGGTGCGATGGSTISANPGGGQTLRLDVFLAHDLTQGLTAHTFSLNFDPGGQNELNLGPMATIEWTGSDVDPGPAVDNYGPLTVGVTTHESPGAGNVGRINSFESGGLLNVLPRNGVTYSVGTATATSPARYRVGQAFFTVNAGAGDLDPADIFSGAFNGLFDVTVDGNGTEVLQATFQYGTAAVNVIPEPATVSLLGLGLVGLVLAGRRARRA